MNFKTNRHKNYTKYKCLIIEDNVFALDILSIFFKRNGIESETAENGQIGLQMYLANPTKYDIIFLDLQMSIMDGYEVAKRIRESGTLTASTITIVAMSGTNTSGVIGKYGVNYFLKKPFELSYLLDIFDEFVDK